MSYEPVFVQYPEDWVGKTIARFHDGKLMLTDSLTAKERLASGDKPTNRHRITEITTAEELRGVVLAWQFEAERLDHERRRTRP